MPGAARVENVDGQCAALRQSRPAWPPRWLWQVVSGLARQSLALVAHRYHAHTRLDNNLVENAIRTFAAFHSRLGRKLKNSELITTAPDREH